MVKVRLILQVAMILDRYYTAFSEGVVLIDISIVRHSCVPQ